MKSIRNMHSACIAALLLAATVGITHARPAQSAEDLATRLQGRIVLQVQDKGQAYYIVPATRQRAYLGRPADAFQIMRELGLGIKHAELAQYLSAQFPRRLSGSIVLDVEHNGEAYYVHPQDLKGYYLGRPADAFQIMRQKGLGITNADLARIPISQKYADTGSAESGKDNTKTSDNASAYRTSPSGWFPPSTCSGEDVSFSHAPVPMPDINHIVPMGKMAAGHVTPTDHGYIITSADNSPVVSDLRSPADGYIVEIGAFNRPNDFRIIIWHSCTVSTIYIHPSELAPEVLAHTGALSQGSEWRAGTGVENSKPIPVTAGQVIGKITGGVDFSVHDTQVTLSGFVTPSRYYGEPWKMHTADMFAYFQEPLQTELKQKSLRTSAPVGGTIDYDVHGRLAGNWFIEGTNYKENGDSSAYYERHLAVAYDHVTPDLVRISVPNNGIDPELCNVCFDVFGAKGNSPNPVGISPTSGRIAYELVALEHVTDPRFGVRGYTRNRDDVVLGVFLVEMLDNRRIRAEVFPGKTASQVSAFTGNAKIYDR